MVTITEIRGAVDSKDWTGLRALHGRAKAEGIEWCDEQTLSTVNLCVLECSMFAGTSAGHTRNLLAMLDAVGRGNHPYDDIITMSTLNTEAAIAKAQLDAIVDPKKK